MTSKAIALRILDTVVIVFLVALAMSVAGLPLAPLFHMSLREFHGFSIFVVSAAMWLMHAIATSDSAP